MQRRIVITEPGKQGDKKSQSKIYSEMKSAETTRSAVVLPSATAPASATHYRMQSEASYAPGAALTGVTLLTFGIIAVAFISHGLGQYQKNSPATPGISNDNFSPLHLMTGMILFMAVLSAMQNWIKHRNVLEIGRYNESYKMLEPEKNKILDIMREERDKSYHYDNNKAKAMVDEIINGLAKNLGLTLNSAKDTDSSIYLANTDVANRLALILQTIHDNAWEIASLGLMKLALEKEHSLQLTPAIIYDFVHDYFRLTTKITGFTPCLLISPESREYLKNLPEEQFKELFTGLMPIDGYLPHIQAEGKSIFIVPKKQLQLTPENQSQLEEKNEILSSVTKSGQTHVTTAKSSVTLFRPSINEEEEKQAIKAKKPREKRRGEADQSRSQAESEEKSASLEQLDGIMINGEEYDLYYAERYSKKKFGAEPKVRTYVFFTKTIKDALDDEFDFYKEAVLFGKLGNQNCQISEDMEEALRKQGYIFKLKLFKKNIEDPGMKRAEVKKFLQEDLELSENGKPVKVRIMICDAIYDKENKQLQLYQDDWGKKNQENPEVKLMFKNQGPTRTPGKTSKH